MQRKYFTVEDLIKFCEEKRMYNFSSKESGKPIVIQAIQDFSSAAIEEVEDNKLYAKIRVCHTLLNRNGSYISEDSMKAAMPSLKYSPLLANIHQLDDGTWDFHSHDYHIETDEKGNETVVYDEKQVGTFTADDPYLEYDKDMDKTYVVARVAIPESYTRCADIIREKNGTKVSCELIVYECSYNAKEKYLQLDNFEFAGCTCLGSEKDGTPIEEGMLGSKITLEDFSEENNSLIRFNKKMIELQERLEKLETTCFNNKEQNSVQTQSEEGGIDNKMTKFEELLAKYGKTVDDITFDYEEMSDEDLEAKFAEMFDDDNTDGDNSDNGESGEPSNDGEGEGDEETSDPESTEDENQSFEKIIRTYEISHEDTKYALYQLLSEYEDADNEWYFINAVYDDHFTYENWNGDKIFGQNYTKDGDNVAFNGERYNLHRELLTDSEFAELQSMRSNYASLKEFKENAEKNELHAQKEEIINSEKYAVIAGKDADGKYTNEDFAKLVESMDDYSVEEFETKVKIMHSDFMAEHSDFSLIKDTSKQTSKKTFNIPSKKESKKSRYGGLFSKKDN